MTRVSIASSPAISQKLRMASSRDASGLGRAGTVEPNERTMPTPSPGRTLQGALPPSNSSACMAWASRCITRWSATRGLIKRPCRIYAPVGGHEDLLAYLVRRLLENGANTSFINRLADDEAPVSEIIRDPVEMAEAERSGAAAARPFVRPREI